VPFFFLHVTARASTPAAVSVAWPPHHHQRSSRWEAPPYCPCVGVPLRLKFASWVLASHLDSPIISQSGFSELRAIHARLGHREVLTIRRQQAGFVPALRNAFDNSTLTCNTPRTKRPLPVFPAQGPSACYEGCGRVPEAQEAPLMFRWCVMITAVSGRRQGPCDARRGAAAAAAPLIVSFRRLG